MNLRAKPSTFSGYDALFMTLSLRYQNHIFCQYLGISEACCTNSLIKLSYFDRSKHVDRLEVNAYFDRSKHAYRSK